MITDVDIENALKKLATKSDNLFQFEYKSPIAPNSSHGLNFEDDKILGTITIWPSGTLEWVVYEIETEKEITVGGCVVNSVHAIQQAIESIVESLRT